MKLKVKGTLSKKIKVSPRGKLLCLHSATSHLKRKDDSSTQRAKSKEKQLSKGFAKKFRKLLGV